MKLIKKIHFLVVILILLTTNHTVLVSAKANEITDYSFSVLEDHTYKKNPYLSFEVGQTYALMTTIDYKNFCASTYLKGDEGFTFTSNNSSIASVDKAKGIITGKKVGSTIITATLPGFSKTTIEVTITPLHNDKSAIKDHEAIKAIDELSLDKFDEKYVIEYYNKLRNLKKGSLSKKEHFINIPNDYKIYLMQKSMDEYLAKQKALFYSIDSIKISKIKELTSKSMTLQLNRKITKADLVAYASANKKQCDTDLLMDVGIYLYTGGKDPMDKSSKQTALVKVSIGLNEDTIIINIAHLLMPNKSYYAGFYYSDIDGDNLITEGLPFISK